jgi:hypothetical protein
MCTVLLPPGGYPVAVNKTYHNKYEEDTTKEEVEGRIRKWKGV